MTAFVIANIAEAVQSRLVEGRIQRFGPLLMLFARPALALLAQGIIFLLFTQLNVANVNVTVHRLLHLFLAIG